jgi:predicted ATPase/DNA-binding SARP family transcriptional activator
MQAIEFRVLGPFEVRRSTSLLATGSGRRQALLASLLLSANRTVSTDRLAAALWGQDQPRSAVNLVQGYVSYWRSLLDPGRVRRASGERLTSTGGGYCLHVADEEFDLLRFRARGRDGRDAVALGELYAARRQLRLAVDERRGPVLADFTHAAFTDAAAAIEADWLSTVEAAADVELRLGRPADALSYVDPLLEAYPLRESLVTLRMLALYRSGRQADALDAFDGARHALADELGVDPGPELTQLHLEVLRQSRSLTGAEVPARRPPVLPSRLSSFVGREQLRVDVRDLLDTHRLVTLTGPAGSGKTRLAVEVAAAIAAAGDRSVAFADLAPVRDSELLWQAVAGAVGRPPPATSDAHEVMTALACSSPTLLVLDNMEHLLEAVPSIAAVLAQAPLLSVLATSREPLGISGEQLVPVGPLATPRPADPPDVIRTSPAVRLFVERARDADPGFTVRDQDVPVVAGICRRLDGLPLTIELAAPLTSTLSLRALLERLDRPVALLGGRRRGGDQPARHRTLRAALDWSYGALEPQQRQLFEQLSVFVSGARLGQVEEVTDLGAQSIAAISELRERNLVYRSGTQDAPRYRLLETIRDYAGERLAKNPASRAATLARHTQVVCSLAERVSREARTGTGAALVERLDAEQDEVRSVLARLARADDPTSTLALAVDCLPLWWDLGYTQEGYDRLTRALTSARPDTPDDLRAAGSIAAVFLADAVGRPEAAVKLGASASHFAQVSGSPLLQSLSLCVQGNTRCWMAPDGPTPDDIAMVEQAVEMAVQQPDTRVRWGWASRSAVLVTALLVLTDLLRYRDARRARAHVAHILTEYEPTTDAYTGSFVLRAAGALDADAGHWKPAQERLTESLTLATRASSLRSRSRSLEELARLSWRRDDLQSAAASAGSATRLAHETGHTLNWVRCAGLAADIALEVGDLARAGSLLDEAEAAAGSSDQQLAVQTTAPRRARWARLSGRPDDAEQYLESAAPLEQAAGLSPDRVVYLLEAAQSARHRGQLRRTTALVQALRDAALVVGIEIPTPERRRLNELITAVATPAPDG